MLMLEVPQTCRNGIEKRTGKKAKFVRGHHFRRRRTLKLSTQRDTAQHRMMQTAQAAR